MKCRSLLIRLGLIVLVTCVSCSLYKFGVRGATAVEEAEKFFVKFSVPSSETQNIWGMTDYRVFGRGMVAEGSPHLTKSGYIKSPETLEIVIPFWCEGKSVNGQALKLRRKLYIRIKTLGTDDKSKWQTESYEFRDDRPLTFLRQVFTWLVWSFIIGPVLMFLELLFLPPLWAYFITGVLTIPFVGYAAFVCFGSAGAVLICIAVYVVTIVVIMKLL